MTKTIIFRQGDVLIKQIEKMPSELKKAKDKVLAWGETTFHKHQFHQEQVQVFENETGTKFVEIIGQPAELVHEEHAMQTIPIGIYEVIIQREMDILGQIKKVTD